ncbi:MAG: metallophosphoesterase family protein [Candidatus Rokubacteria bacterium]|nr:metallophosphoesterase family protein [Candidatus Rokubacteria bacterium]
MNEVLAGVISDTHALIRPEAISVLRGCDLIIHAGDIGSPDVIARLCDVAPTFVVRGNNDTGPWAAGLPVTQTVEVGSLRFYVLHELRALGLDPAAGGFAAVVCGHSHQPVVRFREGVLYLNPGSAGPRRFKLPVTVARVHVSGHDLQPEIVELQV